MRKIASKEYKTFSLSFPSLFYFYCSRITGAIQEHIISQYNHTDRGIEKGNE